MTKKTSTSILYPKRVYRAIDSSYQVFSRTKSTNHRFLAINMNDKPYRIGQRLLFHSYL